MTKFIKKSEINSRWYEIDAKNVVVGRLAAIITKIIRGKNSPKFSPHMDHGDFVVVKNIEHIKFTGNKFEDKKYYRHTGYPGGIKMQTPENILSSKFPDRILKKAVERMMPSGPLANKQIKNLKIYCGTEHPHESQKPELIDFKSMNEKNGKR